jgi:hypothetical protein
MQARKKKTLVNNNQQIPSTKSEINSNFQYPKVDFIGCSGHWSLVLEYYLGFGIWLLGFHRE